MVPNFGFQKLLLAGPGRLSAAHAHGNIPDIYAFQSTTFEPAEDLFISVFRLILGRIPVQSIENPHLRIGVSIYRENMMNRARHWFADRGDRLEPAIQPIEKRNRDSKESVQCLRRHAMSDFSVLITEAVPLVVAAIEPNGDCSTRFQILR